MPVETLLRTARHGDLVELTARGSWTAATAQELEPLVEEVLRESPEIGTIDLGEVRALDTFGAWLIGRLAQHGRESPGARLIRVPEHFAGLLGKVRLINPHPLEE